MADTSPVSSGLKATTKSPDYRTPRSPRTTTNPSFSMKEPAMKRPLFLSLITILSSLALLSLSACTVGSSDGRDIDDSDSNDGAELAATDEPSTGNGKHISEDAACNLLEKAQSSE